MHYSSIVSLVTVVALSASSVFASDPLAKTDKLVSYARMRFEHSTNHNPRAFVTGEEELGQYLRQDPCDPLVVIDLRAANEFNDYQGHIKGAINLPVKDSSSSADKLGKQIERGELPSQLQDPRVQQAKYVVFQAMDDTRDTVPIASAYFNRVANTLPNQEVVIMRNEYKDFRRDGANKMLIEYSPGAQGNMNLGDKIKEGVKGFFGHGAQAIATRLTSRDQKAARRAVVANKA